MKDIATDNLFFINFEINGTTKSEIFERGNSIYNTSRQPTNSLTIDSFIDNLKNKNIEFKDIKNINFVKPLGKPKGLNYTKEFKEHLDKIKKNQVLKDIYNKNTDSDEEDKQQSFQQMQKEIKEQITTIFNILLTVVSCIVACWYWTPYVSISYRLLLCIFVGILVLIADVVVYNSFQRNIKPSNEKRTKNNNTKNKSM